MIKTLHERAAHLPREARDTLFLLAVIGLTIAPHLLHLPIWCGLLASALLLWRGQLAVTGAALPHRGVVTALLLLACGLTLWQERTLLGKEAGITMLVVLMSLKTLELRARRDALVVFFLGFFLVLTHFLYSQSLGTGLWLLGAVWALLTALVLAHMPVGRPPLAQASAIAGRTALLALPVMAVLFVLFPRIGPLWGLPQDAAGRTGLSGSMRLGGVASVAEDDSIALRVRFFGPVPRPDQLYFRGPVLSTFDGREWTRLQPRFSSALQLRLNLEQRGTPLAYEVTMEPSRLPLLPLLEMTPDRADTAPSAPGWGAALRGDGQWQTERPIDERLRLLATAWPDHRHGPRAATLGLRDLVTLPPNQNPRTLQWAAQLRARADLAGADATALSDAVLQHIRRGEYTYTLEPGPYDNNAIDEFWFDRKLGFCEHFAAAFVVIMRGMDVPSRVVTGYQGTDAEPVDGYWIVRQRNAHAWAEIWQSGVGWLRVDPTAAVAPERVQRGRSLSLPPGLVAGAIGSMSPALMASLRGAWEAVNKRWNQWVLGYSRGQQFDLLRALGFESPDWQALASTLIALLCSAALGGAAWAWWDRHRQDPWQRLQRRVQARLQQLGVPVQPHHAPRTRAALVREALRERGEALAELLEAQDRQRYGEPPRKADGRWWRQFAAAARTLAVLMAVAVAASTTSDAIAAPKSARNAQSTGPAYGAHAEVKRFAAEVAQRRGLSRRWIESQLARARRIEAVRKLIMPAPPGQAKNWAAYRERFIEPRRIEAGAAFWRDNAAWLARAEERFGVPAEVVVGIIGVETYYGRITGGFRVIDALATLSFDFPSGRSDRSAFFRGELEELLVLAAREGIDPQTLKGSYAGAIGWPQFLPSSINRDALDFDGDGHVDLRASTADVVGSVAQYLQRAGWQRGMPARFEVTPPQPGDDLAALLAPDILPSFSAALMAARGAALSDAGRQHAGALALVELHNGDAAHSYVVGTQNFWAITRYNASSYYAMAVLDLGQAVAAARAAELRGDRPSPWVPP